MRRYILGSMLLALAGCAGGSSTPSAPNQGCPAFGTLTAGPTLVNPAPNAIGVPDGSFTLQMTWGADPNAAGLSFSLVAQNGTVVVPLGPFTAGNNNSYSYALPALQPKTTYTMNRTVTVSAGCTGGDSVASFTTQ